MTTLDEGDIALLKSYVLLFPNSLQPSNNVLSSSSYFRVKASYALDIKRAEKGIEETLKRVNEKLGVKESETGLAPPNLWDLPADKRRVQEEQTLQVARCTKLIQNLLTPSWARRQTLSI